MNAPLENCANNSGADFRRKHFFKDLIILTLFDKRNVSNQLSLKVQLTFLLQSIPEFYFHVVLAKVLIVCLLISITKDY